MKKSDIVNVVGWIELIKILTPIIAKRRTETMNKLTLTEFLKKINREESESIYTKYLDWSTVKVENTIEEWSEIRRNILHRINTEIAELKTESAILRGEDTFRQWICQKLPSSHGWVDGDVNWDLIDNNGKYLGSVTRWFDNEFGNRWVCYDKYNGDIDTAHDISFEDAKLIVEKCGNVPILSMVEEQ